MPNDCNKLSLLSLKNLKIPVQDIFILWRGYILHYIY